MMLKRLPIAGFVAIVCTLAAAMLTWAWVLRGPFPGLWAMFVFAAVGMLIELSSIQLKLGGTKGSISFVVELSVPILFGGFWAGLIVGFANLVSQGLRKSEPIRCVFNVAQRVLSVVSAALVFNALGGHFPPPILTHGQSLPFEEVLRELLGFLAAAATYFSINNLAVAGAVVISAGQAAREILKSPTLANLGYDIAASLLALLAAWVYVSFDQAVGLGRFVPLLIFLPIVFTRHFYTKLNTVQHLYVELDQAHEKLELALREQLEMMVRSIEARDPYTSGHSRRVSALSKVIATDIGLASSEVDEIETAALLHDVGKIHEEFAPLLKKEGRLTQEEWDIMKTHAAKSAELVGLFTRFRGNIQSAVRSHHERWDGKGYPDSLGGQAIPLGARIIMISDTIDAMSTDRPYRKALSFDKVVAELQKYKGIQFDPSLVEVTVMSVTVRRLLSDEGFLAEQTTQEHVTLTKARARPALRSQSSLLDAFRSSVSDVHAQKS